MTIWWPTMNYIPNQRRAHLLAVPSPPTVVLLASVVTLLGVVFSRFVGFTLKLSFYWLMSSMHPATIE